ncbi:FtsX-like permease family protein [Octadecabacter sp. 1_MG-2023]|uniref:FtsX-like permease family protein n=1 Tax=unclassified Octadecabacter TaxID=196158 RepID=UPI001C096609|nr:MULTISPECIES: FtsX-like permease family protein [unclassified Octadecabacter]MBU2994399.1 FtsX-like permease family protein [Octadecabacter sp. B2R22]MDO6734310.1 FtsX-like permease family protein [Octadecabacter sp. 1_MG-2023]
MSRLLTLLFGRLPIGWLQLTHSRGRFFAAVAGVAFANLLVFMQLGIMGALNGSTVAPYAMLNADIILSSEDGNTLTDDGHIARARMYQALGVAGVIDATPLFVGNLPFTLEDGSAVSLLSFGVDVTKPQFSTPAIAPKLGQLTLESTALLDEGTRGMPAEVIDDLMDGVRFEFETGGNTLTAIGTMEVGGGFLADGMMIMSDQTFLRVFPSRTSGAPNHILVRTADGVAVETVVARLKDALPSGNLRIQSMEASAANDLAYMATERPTGIIFGFGVFMGILVGLVIVYQVLSTDVADHLREYATFKAMGYGQPFFLGIVFEEAIVLAVFGFIPGFFVSMGLYAGLVSVTGLPVEMDASRAILVFLGTLAACSLSGAIATRRLANADPAELF